MKQKRDVMSTAALEIATMERRQIELQAFQLKKREGAIATTFESAGRTKTHGMMEAQHRFMKLVEMKAMKDSKGYIEDLGMTWEQYCEYCGESRRTVDDQLKDLKPFKAEFLAKIAEAFGTELHRIKYLGDAISAKSAEIKGNLLVYDGREIALIPENKDEVQAVLDQIESTYKQQLDDAQGDARAAKKIAKAKEDVIAKQEKALRKFEQRAEGRGLSPEEDAFELQMDNLRTAFDGYMSRVEPDQIEELQNKEAEKVTPRMRSLYLSTLEYMRKQLVAAHDTAVEKFGADLTDGEGQWKQPK